MQKKRQMYATSRAVRRLALILGFTDLRDLCRREGLNQPTLCRMLAGKSTRPSTRERYARALRISLEDLDEVLARAKEGA